MRIADVNFILVPEWLAGLTPGEPDDDHWISRWQRNFATAEWLEVGQTSGADALVVQTSAASQRPVVVVTHGGGVEVLLSAAQRLDRCPVIGAFIVAPIPTTATTAPAQAEAIQRLTFNSVVIASDDHPSFSGTKARAFAADLGSHFVTAGPAGTIDPASGQGPWPEGLMRLGWFLKQLTAH